MPAIDHVDLVVADLERSLAFYAALLEPLGYARRSEIVGERGERVVYLETEHRTDSVGLRQTPQSRPAAPDRYALGLHHVAFRAPSRAVVDEVVAALGAAGATIEEEPREWSYGPGYYACFLHDPDGLKVEVVHKPSEAEMAERVAAVEARIAGVDGRGR